MLVYLSSIDLSRRTLRFLTGQLTARRQEIGTRWRRLPRRRPAADRPHRRRHPVLLRETQTPRHERPGPHRSVRTTALGLAGSVRLDSRPDRRTTARHHRSPRRCTTQMLGGQGVSRRRRTRPGSVSGLPPQTLEAPSQHHPCQYPLPRRAGHGHPQGLAPPAEAALQHQPNHQYGEGRPRPSLRISVRLEKAHCHSPRSPPSSAWASA